ncbi:MAG: ParB N-terminal domain-containing protein [Phycisphaerales bacterium]|nr:ParB N-terminal domain-containing protein [Phycisphaerales bacterium]
MGSIKPYDKNPRKNDAAVEHVARSIREFGFKQPIVLDKDGVIVVGRTRLKAAASLGMTQVPVHVAADLTPEQAKAYRLADKRSAEIAEWELELLPFELGELKDLDFDIASLGWDAEELSEIMALPENAGLVDPDDMPEPPAEATTRPGDLWILGNHRLLCGDSSKPEDVDRLLGGAQPGCTSERLSKRQTPPGGRAGRRDTTAM